MFLASLLFTSHANAQAIVLSPTMLPPGTLGLSYNQTVTATDSDSDDVTGPLDTDDTYTYAVSVGSLPSGLTLNIYTGNIFGTPTVGGTYNFTIQATNQDTSPSSGSQAYSLVIGTNTLTLNPSTLPNGTVGTPYDQAVTASGGSGTYTYSVSAGALPAGLSLNPNTGAITGIPTASSPASFTIEAIDPTTGNYGTRSYNINMGTNSLTLNPATLPSGTKGIPYNQTIAASGGTGPYTYSVSAGTLPAGLSLNSSTGVISGTPSGNGASGFTIQAVDHNGNTGSKAYSINIGSNSLTINPSSLPAGVIGTPYNQTVTATGGTGPYTFSIISGLFPPGLSFNTATGAITGTPTGTGTFSVTIQAGDSNGNIGSRAYAAFVVRPNPANDPDVQGLVAAQAAAARHFTSTQVTNVTGHLEDLHDAFDPCLVNVGIGATVYDPTPGRVLPNPNPQPSAPAGNLPGTCAGRSLLQFPLALWAGGTAQFGAANLNGGSNHFSTGGLTFGVDGRISNSLIVGAALGYGSDRTTVGTDGTSTDAYNFDAMLYASYQPFDGVFFDGVAGYGTLAFNNQRYNSFAATSFAGTRSGATWFGSIAGSVDFKSGPIKISPYLRADLVSASLQGYAEQGTGLALTYGATSFNSTAAVLGLRGTYDIPTWWGVVSPTARLEYRRELDGGFSQSMFYTDLGPGQSYVLNELGTAQNSITGALGLRARAGNSLSSELEYGATAGVGAALVQSIRARLRLSL